MELRKNLLLAVTGKNVSNHVSHFAAIVFSVHVFIVAGRICRLVRDRELRMYENCIESVRELPGHNRVVM